MVRAVHVLPHHRLVEAEAPLKELLGYSTLFRSLTRGSGSFTMEFLRYGTEGPSALLRWPTLLLLLFFVPLLSPLWHAHCMCVRACEGDMGAAESKKLQDELRRGF
jgi:translation elongation factor EF-G